MTVGRKPDSRRDRALLLYWRFGKNLSAVAKEPGMPQLSTLSVWKNEENWDERVEQLQEKFRGILSVQEGLTDKLEFEEDIENYKFLTVLKQLAATAITTGIIPSNYKEVLETLKFVFEQERLMMGRPTDHKKVTMEHIEKMSDEELDGQFRKGTEILGSASSTRKD